MKKIDIIKCLLFPITAIIVIAWFIIEFIYKRLSVTIKKAFTIIKKYMRKVFVIIFNWIKLLRIRFLMRKAKLNKAIRVADKLHADTGKRYRVFFFGDKYHAWHRQDIRRQQSKHLLRRDKKVGADFDQICFYDTNKEGGKNGISNS